MTISLWQRQHIYFQSIVWGVSAAISTLFIVVMLLLGFEAEVAGVFFILTFVALRVLLAVIFTGRFANSMVRILKADYEDIRVVP